MVGSPDNPWFKKLEESPLHRQLDDKAMALYERVSADPEEEVLVTLACAHGLQNRGFLVLTTHWIHWLQKFPKRHEFWPLDAPLTFDGALTSKILVLAGGPQFQPASMLSIGKMKQFYDYYGILQRALAWAGSRPADTGRANESATIPEQIAQLAALRDSGILSAEEFDSKKADLLRRM